MKLIRDLHLKQLTLDAVGEAMVLSREAKWNQVPEDWSFMIRNGEGFGLYSHRSGLAATALTIPYGDRFAWISMILVKKKWRRRGLATDLIRHCIDYLEIRNLIPILDATDAGKAVYGRLGFHEIYALDRMQSSTARKVPQKDWIGPDATIIALESSDITEVSLWDEERFGADRKLVLSDLLNRSLGFACVARIEGGEIGGYLIGRNGRCATQIGPVVADNGAIAGQLLEYAIIRLAGPIFIDLPDQHRNLRKWLLEVGFTPQRGFVRMALNRARPFERVNQVFAVAGPELG